MDMTDENRCLKGFSSLDPKRQTVFHGKNKNYKSINVQMSAITSSNQ